MTAIEIISRREARLKGLKTYYTGRPCIHGHLAERRTASHICVQCDRERARAQQKRNPEQAQKRVLRYRAKHPERHQKHRRTWYEKNYEKWLAASKARPRERQRIYEKAHRDRNPHFLALKSANRRSSMLCATPKWADKKAIAELYEQAASMTKETGILHHVDHIFPLVSDTICGLHVASNLRVIPYHENCSKGNRWSEIMTAEPVLDLARAA